MTDFHKPSTEIFPKGKSLSEIVRENEEYQTQINKIIFDIETQGYLVREVNSYEAQEYCLILYDPENKENIKSYGFEMPFEPSFRRVETENKDERVKYTKEVLEYLKSLVSGK